MLESQSGALSPTELPSGKQENGCSDSLPTAIAQNFVLDKAQLLCYVMDNTFYM